MWISNVTGEFWAVSDLSFRKKKHCYNVARGLKGSRKGALTLVCSWCTRNGPGNGWMWSRPEWGQHIKGTDGSQRSWKGIWNADWAFSETKKSRVNRLIKEWHHLLRILKKEKDLLTCLFVRMRLRAGIGWGLVCEGWDLVWDRLTLSGGSPVMRLSRLWGNHERSLR